MQRKIVTILTICFLLIPFFYCACSEKIEPVNTDRFWYECSSFNVESVDGYGQNIYANLYSNGYYYLLVFGEKLDDKVEGPENYYLLYKIDSKGKLINRVSLPVKCANSNDQVIVDEKLYCIEQNSKTEYVIDVNGGDIISEIKANDIILGLYPIDDGFVKITASSIYRYSKDGNETDRINIQGLDNIRTFYQDQGKYYLVQEVRDRLIFHECDFIKEQMKKVCEKNIDDLLINEINEDLFFSDKGVYKFNVDIKSLIPLTEWNYVDVKPAYKAVLFESNVAYGNARFGKLYEYKDYEIELIIFKNIPANVYSQRIPITIGGYGVELSIAVKWAVYMFNTSQDQYRVYLDDYRYEYSYTTGVEAQSQIVKLIKYFNDGNAPDLYYGTDFDYRYMYNAGLVVDMLPIMENDPDFKMDDMVASIKDTITRNGVCYQIFPAYYFDGDFGLRSIFSDEDITYYQIDEMSQETGLPVRGDMPAAEYADQILRYSLGDFIDRNSEKTFVSEKELKEVIDYSIRNGIPYGAQTNYIADMKSVHDGTYLTCRRTYLGNLYDLYNIENRLNDSFVYLGFPSIYGSVHAARPDGLVAISADTENSDACWKFIRYMLSDEVQKIEIGQGNNPVINSVFEDYCQYASNPEMVPETDIMWNSIVNEKENVPEWIISDYCSMVNSVDMVISYDWGLYNLICEEINSYYLQKKSEDDIAKTLQSRLDLYITENYK